MTGVTCASSPHSSGGRSNADQCSRRPRMAVEPNILHASANVGLLDTNSLRSSCSRDPVQAHKRSLAAEEEVGAQHSRDKPDLRRHRRKSVIRQTRSFRPAREEQAISFSFLVLLAVGLRLQPPLPWLFCTRIARCGCAGIAWRYAKSSGVPSGRFPPAACIYSQRAPVYRNDPKYG
jgi:hypothetical protein